jgi:hypothetical protein
MQDCREEGLQEMQEGRKCRRAGNAGGQEIKDCSKEGLQEVKTSSKESTEI